MVFEDCIGLTADEALKRLHEAHPHTKIILNPTMAPRFKGNICLSKSMVVRQCYNEGVFELTVVMVD